MLMWFVLILYRASSRPENQGLGVERPEDVTRGDDEYDAYRKRMMLAYRFRPNPLVSMPLIHTLTLYRVCYSYTVFEYACLTSVTPSYLDTIFCNRPLL
jgi:hypothetical protein